MRNRVLKAAATLVAFLPSLSLAQQRPAQPPPQRPAAQPAQRPAQRPAAASAGPQAGAITLGIQPSVFIARDGALFSLLSTRVALPADAPNRYVPGAVAFGAYGLTPKIGVGVGIAFGTTSGLTLIQPTVGVSYTFSPAKKLSPFAVVSGGASMWSGDGPNEKATGVGGHGALGVRYMIQENLAVRAEGRVGFENYSENGGFNAIVGRAGVGIQYVMGGGPPRDTDMDGVPDRRDRCANTPRGATVDARGCPIDTDRDGVPDGLDRCAGTAANTPVDANGCPRDSDGDGVPDNADRCANTPRGTPVDANGCPRDSDGDGVPDNADRCANTPRGTPVDANGCPRDTDGDGVNDTADRCPNTPSGVRVDANGCPLDTDGDGVADHLDRCANTARGVQVDANGCPVARDSDGDGVPDERDRCANTPAGRRVDSTGCPIADELMTTGRALVLQNVTFAGGSSRLTPASSATLNDVARQIKGVLERTPTARFEIGGHTDNRGTPTANRRLSQARAQAVVTYLTSQQVPAAALTAVGYGPDQPRGPNTTVAGRAQNRRVEIKRSN